MAQFHNSSDRYLVVRVDFYNATTGARVAQNVSIAPRATTEVGWMEGWRLVSGDSVTLSHADYASATFNIP